MHIHIILSFLTQIEIGLNLRPSFFNFYFAVTAPVTARTRPLYQYALGVELGSSQLGETNRSQTATDVVMVFT